MVKNVPNVALLSTDCVRLLQLSHPYFHNLASGMAASPLTSGSWCARRILSSVMTYEAGITSAAMAFFSISRQSCPVLAAAMSRATCAADKLAFGMPVQT